MKKQAYFIYFEDITSDHEIGKSSTTYHRKQINCINDKNAIRRFHEFARDCHLGDECSNAMGGGCFFFGTNIIGLRRSGSKDWIRKTGERTVPIGKQSSSFHRGEPLPNGMGFRDEYGGI
jgi:hypothetical protein